MSAEPVGSLVPVLFKAVAGHVQLTCGIHELSSGSDSSVSFEYELLVVDAAQTRGWSTKFSLAAVNTALQDEELSAAELCQVLATVLPCQQAVTAVLQDSGQLRLEAWCHRTQRVALLPPTQQQRRPDSDYRQAAFCVGLPVSLDLTVPGWMQQQEGEAFAAINKGLLAVMLHRDERLQGSVLRLQSQLQLLFSHTAQLQLVADRAVRMAVRGTTGLKDDPTKASAKQQQQQGTSPLAQKVSTGVGTGAGAAAGAGAGAGFSAAGLFGGSQHALHSGVGFALVLSSQVAAGGAGAGAPVQRAGSGGSSRAALGGAAAAGGRAHLARQSQDDKTLRQMWNEQQALAQDWQQRLQQLVGYQGPLEAFAQLAQSLGAGGVVANAGHAVALPWHLGQQPEEEEQQQGQEQPAEQPSKQVSNQQQQQPSHQPEQTETRAHAHSVLEASVPLGLRVGSRTAVIAAAAAAGAHGTQQAGAGAAAAVQGALSVVAPAKQKQVAGAKRRAHDGQSLLKRGRR